MKIIWLSANLFGLRLLEEAIKHVDISAIITLSDTSKTVMYDGVNKRRWYKFGIDVHEIEDINKEIQLLKKLNPDFIIMCGWRQMITQEILKIPKSGIIIGFHPTMLPKGRGPAPIINTLLKGYKESGVTMFAVSDGLDNGDIIEQIPFDIKEEDAFIAMAASLFEIDYLVTLNRKHLRNKEGKINILMIEEEYLNW